jgi:LAO/AO transport system kinase
VHQYIVNASKSTNELEIQYEQHKKNASELKSNPSSEAKIFVEQLLHKKL